MNCLSGLRPFSLFALFLICGLPLRGEPFPSESQRLIATAKLWVTIKYFHPYIASRPIDWDKALVEKLPAIRGAQNDSDFQLGIAALVAPLQDPLTVVSTANSSETLPSEAPAGSALRTWMHHGLPSSLPTAVDFYQAFIIRSGSQIPVVALPMDSSFHVNIRLGEPATLTDPIPHPLPDSWYNDTPYPSVELRILSAFRIWGVIHNFFAYKDLMDEDWDAVFAEALPRFIAASSAQQYHLAVAEMISHLSDSNSSAQSAELDQYFGEASPGVKIGLIEKKAAITEIVDDAAKTAGLHLGDIVSVIDGEKVSERVKREATYLSVSTAQALSAQVAEKLLNGPAGSIATLTVLGSDDRPLQIKIKRTRSVSAGKVAEPHEAFRIVNSNIGYVNLTKLTPSSIDSMFQQLHATTAIIFDARGPIAPMASQLAACLSTRPEITTAIVTGPLSLEPDLPRDKVTTTTSSYFAMETQGKTCATPYQGKTLMLIDERTIGNAEHLGLALEAANGTEFLGTPSAGADSAVTEFNAPGGIVIRFSGQDVRHANAGPIQRMGLQPALALAPKIAAVRAGRDAVLEKALEYLKPPATQAALN